MPTAVPPTRGESAVRTISVRTAAAAPVAISAPMVRCARARTTRRVAASQNSPTRAPSPWMMLARPRAPTRSRAAAAPAACPRPVRALPPGLPGQPCSPPRSSVGGGDRAANGASGRKQAASDGRRRWSAPAREGPRTFQRTRGQGLWLA